MENQIMLKTKNLIYIQHDGLCYNHFQSAEKGSNLEKNERHNFETCQDHVLCTDLVRV
jgi:hypothetical protein